MLIAVIAKESNITNTTFFKFLLKHKLKISKSDEFIKILVIRQQDTRTSTKKDIFRFFINKDSIIHKIIFVIVAIEKILKNLYIDEGKL
ncbi:hypothetical protein QJS64_21440 (plasmid) [Paraclostridium bifermentans]|uniref:HTH rpiR-type domain-containing protein n=1 Tax=Paraclostridium bifermentans TaxID=1490 RepID=A0ABY8R839_PARBF|nr:hypothetical protein QJS64_21440 [Paraclostridium bifermentans]